MRISTNTACNRLDPKITCLAVTQQQEVATSTGDSRDARRQVDVIVLERGDAPTAAAETSGHEANAATICHPGNPLQGNLARAFLTVARCRAWHTALVSSRASYSYAWLEAAAMAVRHELLDRPTFEPGARVALLLGNSPEYLAAFYGILLAGGVAVPLPADIEIDRLDQILQTCETTILLTAPEVLRRRHDFPGEPARRLPLGRTRLAGILDPDSCEQSAEGLAAILFTAGSTGKPKGVMLSHGNLLSNAWSISEYLDIGPDERALVVLPFYHAFGNSVLQTHVLCGATLILGKSLTFPNSILEGIRKHQVTSFSGVPAVYQTLLARSSLGSRRLGSLRYMTVAGGALRPEHALEVSRRVAPARFYIMYGQTEATARLSYLRPELLKERSGSIGKGMPGVTLQVVDEHGRLVAPGERGEIRARGPNVMLGYWRDPEATSQVIRDGWLYTGDWASVDCDGFIFPQGRSNALLKVAGFRVHPSEVEEYAMQRLPILRAVVVAYELEDTGTRLALFVQPRQGTGAISLEQVNRICSEGLPRHKVPAYTEIVDDLPLNDAMKVDRLALSRRAAQRARVRGFR